MANYSNLSITMDKQFTKDAFFWGFILWLIGYVLGIILFFIVPKGLIGLLVTPVGILVALWVLQRKIKGASFGYYLRLAAVWTLIAVVFDYFFNVKLFGIGSSYYQADIYLYYAVTFLLPPAYWQLKKRRK